MNFACEIRKAKEQARLIENFDINDEQVTYYCIQIVWPDILIFTNVLRQYAGYLAINKLEKSMLYLLKYSIKNAMLQYDEVGAKDLKKLISTGLYINHPYIFQLYQYVHSDFTSQPSGKRRFRKLYVMVREYLSSFSDLNERIISDLEKSAQKFDCKVTDIEVGNSSDVEW